MILISMAPLSKGKEVLGVAATQTNSRDHRRLEAGYVVGFAPPLLSKCPDRFLSKPQGSGPVESFATKIRWIEF